MDNASIVMIGLLGKEQSTFNTATKQTKKLLTIISRIFDNIIIVTLG